MTLYFVPFAASLLNLTGTKPVVASAAAAMLVLAPSSAVPSAESGVKLFCWFGGFVGLGVGGVGGWGLVGLGAESGHTRSSN